MSTLAVAAVTHLRMLQVERNPAQNRTYVVLAFTYGVPVDVIAEESGIPIEVVRQILGGH